jgi:hypothetical protein
VHYGIKRIMGQINKNYISTQKKKKEKKKKKKKKKKEP